MHLRRSCLANLFIAKHDTLVKVRSTLHLYCDFYIFESEPIIRYILWSWIQFIKYNLIHDLGYAIVSGLRLERPQLPSGFSSIYCGSTVSTKVLKINFICESENQKHITPQRFRIIAAHWCEPCPLHLSVNSLIVPPRLIYFINFASSINFNASLRVDCFTI